MFDELQKIILNIYSKNEVIFNLDGSDGISNIIGLILLINNY
jgi:hypothetical protein